MVKIINCLKKVIGCLLILLQVLDSWCRDDLSQSVVQIYSDGKYFCAGTLVKETYVVTADGAFFWYSFNVSKLLVVGNTEGDTPTPDSASFVSEVFRPEYPNRDNYDFLDVAVLKLENPIVGPNIKSAKLCKLNSFENGEPLTFYYWSINQNRATQLKTSNVSVLDKDTCSKIYVYAQLIDSAVCGQPDEEVCNITGVGGPAAIRGQFCGLYYGGDWCISSSKPGAFTSLADPDVLAFINQAICQ